MTVPTSKPPTANLELLRKLVQEFQPNPRRIPFRNLEPFRDSIETLRAKGASYTVIADLLREHGVKTSRARVAEYGRIALEKKKPRKRRKPTPPLVDVRSYDDYTTHPASRTVRRANSASVIQPSSARPAHCQCQDGETQYDLIQFKLKLRRRVSSPVTSARFAPL
ncbi:MAG: hypothetical protein L0Z50_34150 [Verrucomicrobiales bacterium]|nr:hypothetical protein [Verrucomicrobiales bacterium]